MRLTNQSLLTINRNIDILKILGIHKDNNDIANPLNLHNGIPDVSRAFRQGKDSYVPGESSIYELYVGKAGKSRKFSDSVLDVINFEYNNFAEDMTSFTVDGVRYLKKDIPEIAPERCLEIRAKNNELKFESGKYYKFPDRDGKYHVLGCTEYDISQPYSEQAARKQNEESYQMGKFWSVLGCEGVYGSMYYSKDEQRKLLNDAGIQEGFFSVQVGTKKTELFYSNGVAGVVVPKRRYDSTYNMFMNTNILEDFAVGSVFVIGGKEYTLNADKKMDIPYGADIYDIKYPLRENQ